MGLVCPDCDKRRPAMCSRHGGRAGEVVEVREEEEVPTAGVGEVETVDSEEEEGGPTLASEEE